VQHSCNLNITQIRLCEISDLGTVLLALVKKNLSDFCGPIMLNSYNNSHSATVVHIQTTYLHLTRFTAHHYLLLLDMVQFAFFLEITQFRPHHLMKNKWDLRRQMPFLLPINSVNKPWSEHYTQQSSKINQLFNIKSELPVILLMLREKVSFILYLLIFLTTTALIQSL